MIGVALLSLLAGGPRLLAGEGWMFRLTSPRGWLPAPARPGQAGRWVRGPAELTASVAAFDLRLKDGAERAIAAALTAAREARPGAIIAQAGIVTTDYEDRATVYAVGRPEPEGDRTVVAFVTTPTRVVALALSAPDRATQDEATEDFARLVRSFGWVTGKVRGG